VASAKLIIRSPGKPCTEVSLSGGASIGRAYDNSVQLQADGVSRYHAVIEQRVDGFWLTDLGSRNGTVVKGVTVAAERKLEDGDSIVVGGVATVEFHVDPRHPGEESEALCADPSQTIYEANSSQAKTQSDAESAGVSGPLKIGVAIVAVVAVVFIVARLVLPTGQAPKPDNPERATPPITASRAEVAPPDPNLSESDRRAVAEQPNDALDKSPEVDSSSGANPELSLLDVQSLSDGLARQISDRGGYSFQRPFVDLIRSRVPDYGFEFSDEARRYGREIQLAFNDQGLKPLLGLIVIMSQSKFKNTNTGNTGMWRLSPALARDLGILKPSEDESVLRDSKRSAEIAAAYLKNLRTQFGGPENFMYAIAFYGEPSAKVSEAVLQLEKLDPQRTGRLDFWRMVDAKVVNPVQAERVARFFAAGIVGENPRKLGLRSEPLSLIQ
jgi:FHA domain-containing protein